MISSGGSPAGVPNEPECPAVYNHTGYVCGIESVWVCLAATDTEFSTPLSVFHTPEFVGEWNGSSAEDLLAAVEFAGYKAELLSNISVADLRFFDHPQYSTCGEVAGAVHLIIGSPSWGWKGKTPG